MGLHLHEALRAELYIARNSSCGRYIMYPRGRQTESDIYSYNSKGYTKVLPTRRGGHGLYPLAGASRLNGPAGAKSKHEGDVKFRLRGSVHIYVYVSSFGKSNVWFLSGYPWNLGWAHCVHTVHQLGAQLCTHVAENYTHCAHYTLYTLYIWFTDSVNIV